LDINNPDQLLYRLLPQKTADEVLLSATSNNHTINLLLALAVVLVQ